MPTTSAHGSDVMIDRDPITKRKFFYTVPISQAKKKALIPQQYRDKFDAKEITCGASARSFKITSSS